MFDAKQPITIHLRTPEGVKTVRVRFPTERRMDRPPEEAQGHREATGTRGV